MAFKKYQSAEKVQPVQKDESEAIRTVVKEAGVKSASELTDEQRQWLKESGL